MSACLRAFLPCLKATGSAVPCAPDACPLLRPRAEFSTFLLVKIAMITSKRSPKQMWHSLDETWMKTLLSYGWADVITYDMRCMHMGHAHEAGWALGALPRAELKHNVLYLVTRSRGPVPHGCFLRAASIPGPDTLNGPDRPGRLCRRRDD